jgi:protein-S-isoprenylcysteine O-methyltransferase Ste14
MTYVYYIALVLAAACVGGGALANRPVGGDLPAGPVSGHLLNLGAHFLAFALIVVACLGRIWCSAFIAGHKDAHLVTDGPYSLCRHPLYVFSFIGGIGLGLATGSLALTVITALVLAALLASAARAEERRLGQLYGDEFRHYSRSTPRWWPQWHAQRVPAELSVQPRVFWKSFLDAGSFVLLFLIIDFVRSLREVGVIPTLFVLP